jgi:hypothetical protein
MNPAAEERRRTEAQPERFCPHPKCLWRASSGQCPKHQACAVEGPTPDNTPQDAADYSGYAGDKGLRRPTNLPAVGVCANCGASGGNLPPRCTGNGADFLDFAHVMVDVDDAPRSAA